MAGYRYGDSAFLSEKRGSESANLNRQLLLLGLNFGLHFYEGARNPHSGNRPFNLVLPGPRFYGETSIPQSNHWPCHLVPPGHRFYVATLKPYRDRWPLNSIPSGPGAPEGNATPRPLPRWAGFSGIQRRSPLWGISYSRKEKLAN